MSWREKFIADAENMFNIPRRELEEFLKYMSEDPEKIHNWSERLGISEADFLMLTTIYTLYKTEEKVLEILSNLELHVDEAVSLVSTAAASVLNSLDPGERKPILAQMLLATALQLEDKGLRESLAEYAKLLFTDVEDNAAAGI